MLYMRSLVMIGRQDVVEKALAMNLETMQPDPTAAASHQAAQAACCLPMLGLSEQQQEFIAAGMGLYFDILQSIHQERQQLNSQMTAATAEESEAITAADKQQDSGCRSISSGADMASLTCSGSSSGDHHVTLPDRQEQLQKQQQLTSRLNLLLHKEVSPHARMHVLACSGVCWGWVQVFVLCWGHSRTQAGGAIHRVSPQLALPAGSLLPHPQAASGT